MCRAMFLHICQHCLDIKADKRIHSHPTWETSCSVIFFEEIGLNYSLVLKHSHFLRAIRDSHLSPHSLTTMVFKHGNPR